MESNLSGQAANFLNGSPESKQEARKDKKHIDYRSFNHCDVLEDIREDCQVNGNLLIPEINFEAPTPRVPSPCLSRRESKDGNFFPPKRDFILKFNDETEKVAESCEEKVTEETEYKITDQDWDRMEAIAETERLQYEAEVEASPEEANENRRKLEEFRKNPKVDISKSRLAEELKMILAEAQRRIDEEQFPESRLKPKKPKKKKKQPKEVTFDESKSSQHIVPESTSTNVQDVLMKVEMEMVDDLGAEDAEVSDADLLNGFMDGFDDEDEDGSGDQEQGASVTDQGWRQLNVDRRVVITTGVVCLVAFGAAMFLHKLSK